MVYSKFRYVVFALLVAACFAAPAAFARSHVSVGVNLGFPGVSLGYSDCRHCGWGYGYSTYYAPAYYAPTYYAPAPVYYDYPAYGSVYYYDRPYRGHYRGGYGRGYDRHDHGRRDYGHRASYYDRGGSYRH